LTECLFEVIISTIYNTAAVNLLLTEKIRSPAEIAVGATGIIALYSRYDRNFSALVYQYAQLVPIVE
jgi:hypothetical protein